MAPGRKNLLHITHYLMSNKCPCTSSLIHAFIDHSAVLNKQHCTVNQ